MKNITRLSLALIMFSLFSISYLVTSVSAQDGMPLICDDPSDADHMQNGQPCVQPESCNQGDPRLGCISDERAVPRGTVNAAPAQGETDVGGHLYRHNR